MTVRRWHEMSEAEREAYQLESSEDRKYRVTLELVVDSGFELDVEDLVSTLETAITYQAVRVEIADSLETTWPDLTQVRVLLGHAPRPVGVGTVRDAASDGVV